jgi:thiamine biosynthesis lipoprotein ApbE
MSQNKEYAKRIREDFRNRIMKVTSPSPARSRPRQQSTTARTYTPTRTSTPTQTSTSTKQLKSIEVKLEAILDGIARIEERISELEKFNHRQESHTSSDDITFVNVIKF